MGGLSQLHRAENAPRAVDLLGAVLDPSLRSKTLAAQEWARQNTGIIEQVRALRGEVYG